MAGQKILVKSAYPAQPDGGHKLAIFERDDRHVYDSPEEGTDGELWIADDKVHEVYLTPGVKTALNEGRLKEWDGEEEVEDDSEPITAGNSSEFSQAELETLSRAELDALAGELGIDTAPMKNKGEVAAAIVAHNDEPKS